eukprot:jgi/Mesvir1/20947/Mv08018-RA.1
MADPDAWPVICEKVDYDFKNVGFVCSAAASADGKLFAYGSQMGALHAIDEKTSTCITTGSQSQINSIIISKDRSTIYTSDIGGTLTVWTHDPKADKPWSASQKMKDSANPMVWTLELSPAENTLFAGGIGFQIYEKGDDGKWAMVSYPSQAAYIYASTLGIALADAQNILYTAGSSFDGSDTGPNIAIWRLAAADASGKRNLGAEGSCSLLEKFATGHTKVANCIKLGDGGQRMYTGGGDGCVRVWKVAYRADAAPALECLQTFQEAATMGNFMQMPQSLGVFEMGVSAFCLSSADTDIKVWSPTASSGCLQMVQQQKDPSAVVANSPGYIQAATVGAFAMSKGGTHLAMGGRDHGTVSEVRLVRPWKEWVRWAREAVTQIEAGVKDVEAIWKEAQDKPLALDASAMERVAFDLMSSANKSAATAGAVAAKMKTVLDAGRRQGSLSVEELRAPSHLSDEVCAAKRTVEKAAETARKGKEDRAAAVAAGEKQAQILAQRSRRCEGLPPGQLPPLEEGCKYHFFISHYQKNGGDQCMALKASLTKVYPDIGVWYDQDESPTEAGMREGVSGSETFMLFLTDGVLTRPAVQLEVREALRLGKPILLVHEQDERHGFAPMGTIIEQAPLDVRVVFQSTIAITYHREGDFRRVMLAKILRQSALPVPPSLAPGGGSGGAAAGGGAPEGGSGSGEVDPQRTAQLEAQIKELTSMVQSLKSEVDTLHAEHKMLKSAMCVLQ